MVSRPIWAPPSKPPTASVQPVPNPHRERESGQQISSFFASLAPLRETGFFSASESEPEFKPPDAYLAVGLVLLFSPETRSAVAPNDESHAIPSSPRSPVSPRSKPHVESTATTLHRIQNAPTLLCSPPQLRASASNSPSRVSLTLPPLPLWHVTLRFLCPRRGSALKKKPVSSRLCRLGIRPRFTGNIENHVSVETSVGLLFQYPIFAVPCGRSLRHGYRRMH